MFETTFFTNLASASEIWFFQVTYAEVWCEAYIKNKVSTFPSEINTEHIWKLLHEDFSHLQRAHYNLQVLTGQHGSYVATDKIQTFAHISSGIVKPHKHSYKLCISHVQLEDNYIVTPGQWCSDNYNFPTLKSLIFIKLKVLSNLSHRALHAQTDLETAWLRRTSLSSSASAK